MITVAPKITGGNYSADELTEGVSQECQNTVLDSGIVLDNTGVNLSQQKEAILRYGSAGNQYVDSGGANTYVLNSIQNTFNIDSYIDGMIVNFVAVNTSTGASTVNVNGLGVKTIVDIGDIPLTFQSIISNIYFTLRYDLSADKFFLISPNGETTIKAHVRASYVGAQSAGQNPTLQRQANIASIVSLVEGTGGFVWQVTFTTPIDTPLINATGWDTNSNTIDNLFTRVVTNTGFDIYMSGAGTFFLNGFMFTII